MSWSKKGIAALLAALVVVLTGCGGGSDEANEVRFGYIGDYNGASLLAVAEDQKLWEKHGLTATASVFNNGPLQIQALGSGDLDFGYIGPGAMWLPASGQAKVVALNTLGNADRVIAQPGITSVADLRGKTVGVPQGTSGEMILDLALRNAGMTKNDVRIVPMDASTIVSAFSAQRIDAAGFWYPAIDTIKKQVPGLVELVKNSDFTGQMEFPTAFVAGNEVVTGQQDKARRVLAVLRDAMRYRTDNAKRTIELTADMLDKDPAQVRADAANVKALGVDELDRITGDGTAQRWLSAMDAYFTGTGQLEQSTGPQEYYTGELFTSAGNR
ncbi:aliphatic sulfonate ABC transporter substrate-binding protein [Saccharopolyspora dendranthemae]|uniref:NitT/TauT family transport system substrate-binding protein n=1 Tax=Saccharopolyspora dendranthemae TaxID=1181886 RepID=A0A561V8J0_9PSEU|nr:aliphatic sulfonate ABC transporter substrate-binding protein [Saccharopolyspora dendranthemae]TWG07928.1 NitT/TauT family transport system substrate-binding protein [Saccharopolyspora dendranthemae]